MRVLTLQLRNEDPEQLESSEEKIYNCCMVCTAIIWIGVLISTAVSMTCQLREEKNAACLSSNNKQKSQRINATMFAILFFLMVLVSIPLCKVIHKAAHSNRQLSKNVRWVTSIFGLFMFAFLSRSIYDYSTTINGSYVTVYLGLALPLVWDFLPILIMSLMHYRD